MRSSLPWVRTAAALCIAVAAIGSAVLAAEPAWWRDAVFYEVFVRSFQDSDGDGKGDLSGLIERLDYLNDGDPATSDDLGVTALWLMPIMESPSYHGYDVVDYDKVDRDYGTNADFQRLVAEAHARGMRVIVDLVLNHTSSQNPWFGASLSRGSPYRSWYIWSDTDPGYAGPWGTQVWHARGGAFYYGLFWSGMPDLDYRNPDVTARMLEVARSWLLDLGADGFRLDAVRHLIEDGTAQQDTRATHDWLKGLRSAVKSWAPDAYLVGEVWAEPEIVAAYLDREIDQGFEFSLAEAVVSGVRDAAPQRITSALSRVLATYPDGAFATFLSNHDQDRAMSRLLGSSARAKLAAAILLTLPGTPFLYYGEEVGMTGTKPDERIRAPMQWSTAPGAGFTSGVPWEALQPDAALRTVEAQSVAADSLLARYRALIRLRLDHEALRRGATALVEANSPFLAYTRSTEKETLLVLHNLAPVTAPASLRVPASLVGRYLVRDVAGTRLPVFASVSADGSFVAPPIVIGPYATLVLSLSRL